MPGKSKFDRNAILIFSEEELKLLVDVANSRFGNGVLRYRNGWGIILMIYTGLRMGEALALKWEDYNEEEQTLLIRKNIGLIKNRTGKGKNIFLLNRIL